MIAGGGLNTGMFECACNLIANTNGELYLLGGRITRALAPYTFTHLQVVRPDVTLFLLDALIEKAQNRMWTGTREHTKTLENLFDNTRLFHKLLPDYKN